ncbi:MAG TPA: hypothetical protein VGR14_01740 [Verrucomicrobiae bacterium]|jgi:hypothetical protein|nr:hypothetical protein [Verrucomicrobiae bacterium]
MSDQPKSAPSISERSTLLRFFRWLFSARGMWRVLIVLAWTVTIIALWYGEENWRGRRAWNQYREATEARGESLNFADYIPKSVPDEQNFAETPFLRSLILRNGVNPLTNDIFTLATDHVAETNLLKDRGHRHFTDLVAWQLASAALQHGKLEREQEFETDQTDLAARAAAAPAILEGMKPDQETFEELRAGSAREYSRYAVKYDLENPWGILLPHLAGIKGVCLRLHLQTCAELAANKSDQALADEKLMLALADSIKPEPFLISLLVRASCVEIAIQPVWEGLAEHRWTDAQLQELQARFLSYNFLADLRPPLKDERACGVQAVDALQKKGLGFIDNFTNQRQDQWGLEKPAFDVLRNVMPSGWFYREKLNFCTLFDAQTQGILDPVAKTTSPSKVASNGEELSSQLYDGHGASVVRGLLRHRLVAALLLPALQNITFKAAMAQTTTDQAAVACALERFRLAHGQFPDQLDALTPQYMSRLPNDVITGQPYKYRRTDDGQFVLYSVGWNEKDDGGVPGKTLFDQREGDWVWSYPSK